MIQVILSGQEAGPGAPAALAGALWIDVQEPTLQEMDELSKRFRWHHLSVEDALRFNQRPKLDRYEDHQFLVLYSARYEENQGLALSELHIFLGSDYIVTVHREPLPALTEARQRWETHPRLAGRGEVPFLLYAVLDAVVDGYFPILDAVGERVGRLEEGIFEDLNQGLLREALGLRREMLAFRRILMPERDIVDHLLRGELLARHPELAAYFTDVYDHLLRLGESLDLQRELLTNVLEGYLTLASNRLNQVMKFLTAIAAILMVATLIAGIYGMNFQNIPELEWPFGYYLALGFMALATGGLAFFFWRRGWF